MSLSAHERTQFERLTANLQLGDAAALKKLRKKDRATTMSYMPLPSRSTILLVLTVINVFIFVCSVQSHNAMLTVVTGTFGMLLTAAIVLNSLNRIETVNRNPKAKN